VGPIESASGIALRQAQGPEELRDRECPSTSSGTEHSSTGSERGLRQGQGAPSTGPAVPPFDKLRGRGCHVAGSAAGAPFDKLRDRRVGFRARWESPVCPSTSSRTGGAPGPGAPFDKFRDRALVDGFGKGPSAGAARPFDRAAVPPFDWRRDRCRPSAGSAPYRRQVRGPPFDKLRDQAAGVNRATPGRAGSRPRRRARAAAGTSRR
jgi:hypothetical protein